MQKKFTSQSAPARRGPWLAVVFTLRRLGDCGFVSLRVLIASAFCLAGVLIAFGGGGFSLGLSKAQAQPGAGSAAATANSRNGPDIVPLVGPVCVNTDLRDLPYIPPSPQIPRDSMTRFTQATTEAPVTETSRFPQFPALLTEILTGPFDAAAAVHIRRYQPR